MVITHNRPMDANDCSEDKSSKNDAKTTLQLEGSCGSAELGIEMASESKLQKYITENNKPIKSISDKSKYKRSPYSIEFKLKVLDFLEELNVSTQTTSKYELVTKRFKITKSMVSKWNKQKELLREEVKKSETKLPKHQL